MKRLGHSGENILASLRSSNRSRIDEREVREKIDRPSRKLRFQQRGKTF